MGREADEDGWRQCVNGHGLKYLTVGEDRGGGDNDGGAGTAKDGGVRNLEGSSPAPIRSIHVGPGVPAV